MAKDEKTIAHVLTEIVGTYGAEVFKERRKVYSLLSDMAPGDCWVKERRRIKAALESGAVDILLEAAEGKADCELYINESVYCLISQTDMAEEAARDTILSVAEAFSLTASPPSETAKTEISTEKSASAPSAEEVELAGDRLYKSRQKKKKILLSIVITTSVLAVATMLVGIFLSESPLNDWLIGIASGFVLTGLTIGIAYAFQEFILFNEMCQTITIILPILFVTNIVLRIVLGDVSYRLIFQIISVFLVVGAIANAVYTRVDIEEKWTWPNVVIALCSAFLFFLWPGHFSWTTWQWIISIGGGLLLAVLVFFLVEFLDAIGPERFVSLSVLLLLLTVANFLLLVTVGENYWIIAQCYALLLAIGGVIATVLSFYEASTGLGFWNLILALVNGGVFTLFVLDSFEPFSSAIQNAFDTMNLGS